MQAIVAFLVEEPLLLLFIVAGLGYLLGNVKVKGISLLQGPGLPFLQHLAADGNGPGTRREVRYVPSGGLLRVARGADEFACHRGLPASRPRSLATIATATRPEGPDDVGAHGSPGR